MGKIQRTPVRAILFIFTLLLCFMLPAVPCRAVESLDEWLRLFRDKHHYPALAAAVVREGRIVALGVTGVREWGGATPATHEDAWHLGSCTKAMTATLIAMLIEEGKLRWDAPLAELFPELTADMHSDYRRVTVDQLLAHRSGLPNETWPRGKTFSDIHNLPGTVREQRMQFVRMKLAEPPEAPPGTRFIYSNTGYTVLGAILERVTDTAWEQLMEERLFMPLGMTTAGFGPMGTEGRVDQPLQHHFVDGKPVPVPPLPTSDNPPAIAPSGRVHCSMRDWTAFLMALMKDKQDGGLLTPETRKRLWTPQFDDIQTGGWVVAEKDSDMGPVFQHAGSNTMNYCFAVLAPDRQAAVLVAVNRGGDTLAAECGELANRLFEKYPVAPQ